MCTSWTKMPRGVYTAFAGLMLAQSAVQAQPAVPPSAPPLAGPTAGSSPQAVPRPLAIGSPGNALVPVPSGGGRDLSVQEAVERALAQGPELRRLQALEFAAKEGAAEARLGRLPRLETMASYTRVGGFPEGRIVAGGFTQTLSVPHDRVALSASISYPVTQVWLRVLPAIEAADAGAEAAQARVRVEESQLRLRVQQSYYHTLRARGVLAVMEAAVARSEAEVQEVRAAIGAGVLASPDGASATARLAAARQDVVVAKTALEVEEVALGTLLGDEPGTRYRLSAPLHYRPLANPLPQLGVLLEYAFERRSESVALRASLAAEQAQARLEEAGRYPSLAVYAGADYARPNRYVIPPGDGLDPSWELGVSLSYSPNDTLTAQRRLGGARAQVQARQAELAALRQALRLEVSTARAQVLAAAERITAAQATSEAALAAYDQRLAGLQVGTEVLADVFVAADTLNRARLSELDAVVEAILAKAVLAYTVASPLDEL